VELASGSKIPCLGLGTYLNTERTKEVIKSAILDHGYRHIDTATDYENEAQIGEALEECMAVGVAREDLFITTKIWISDYGDIEGACRESLRKLRLSYIDMFMMHWMVLPLDFESEDWRPTTPPFYLLWKQMEGLVDQNLVKNIAVSNCTIPMMVDLLAGCRIKPAVN